MFATKIRFHFEMKQILDTQLCAFLARDYLSSAVTSTCCLESTVQVVHSIATFMANGTGQASCLLVHLAATQGLLKRFWVVILLLTDHIIAGRQE